MIQSLASPQARRLARQAATLLAQDPRVRLVYLFGSAVHGQPRARDIDLAIWTKPRISLEELLELRARIVDSVPAPIDLISLDRAGVVLGREVVDAGICLYRSDPDVETETVTRMRARYWDFKPFLDEQWRLAGERLRERQVGS